MSEETKEEQVANDRYVKAAEFRAAALAFINKCSDWISSGHVIREMQIADKMNYISKHAAYTQLRNLANNGFIASKQEGKNFFYAPKSFNGSSKIKVEGDTKVNVVKLKADVNEAKKKFPIPGVAAEPDLKLDVVKSSNKVRITVAGILIEIGVADE